MNFKRLLFQIYFSLIKIVHNLKYKNVKKFFSEIYTDFFLKHLSEFINKIYEVLREFLSNITVQSYYSNK